MPRLISLTVISLALLLGPAIAEAGVILVGATACEEGFKLKNGKCVPRKKAAGCPAGTVPVPETDNCVKATPAQLEKEPWRKPGCKKWQKQCDQGNATACAKFESTCQVN